MTRLANEFFHALPGQAPALPSTRAVTSAVPGVTSVVPAMTSAVPAAGIAGASPIATGSPPGASAVPRFYFLDEFAPAATAVPVSNPLRGLALADGGGIAAVPAAGLDVEAVRRDFPILAERVHGRPLVWLDSAATTQKPTAVIDRLGYFYRHENSNIHRGAHGLAARAGRHR